MRTRDKLAAELRKVADIASPDHAEQYESLAKRAETGEFDDFGDAHDCPITFLYHELKSRGFDKFAQRVANGEFDGTLEDSEEWARSITDPEVLALMEALGVAPKRDKDH